MSDEIIAFLKKHLQSIQENDTKTYNETTADDLTLYEWWITPHRIDGLPFHEFMMSSNAERGAVFGAEAKGKSTTRFDLSNLHVQHYGDSAIASYTLLISTASAERREGCFAQRKPRDGEDSTARGKLSMRTQISRVAGSAYPIMKRFNGRLALQQRVLPNYRAPFFDLLASACDGGMSLFTGLPRPSEGITTTDELRNTQYVVGKNIHLFGGSLYLCYQQGLTNWLKEWNPDALIVECKPALSFHLIRRELDARTR
ncbi:MAG: hypothetical protein U0X87_09015 [Anaerolineales bacterium]